MSDDRRSSEVSEAVIEAIEALPDRMTRSELILFFMATLSVYDIEGEDAETLFAKAAISVKDVNAGVHAQLAIQKAQQEDTEQ